MENYSEKKVNDEIYKILYFLKNIYPYLPNDFRIQGLPINIEENTCKDLINFLNELQIVNEKSIDTNNPEIEKKKKISELMDELGIKNSKIMEQQNCIHILESALRENSNIAELEQLLAVIKSKDDRINELEQLLNSSSINFNTNKIKDDRIIELEEALKQSVLIATEREKIFYDEEKERLKMIEKVYFHHSFQYIFIWIFIYFLSF